jgi:hypothetical protein
VRVLGALLLLGLAALLALPVGCQKRLQPPAPSYKPPRHSARAERPQPSGARSGGEAIIARPEPLPGKEGASAVAADPGERPFDPGRPCFTASRMERAQAVLFPDGPDPRGERWASALNTVFHDLKVPCDDEDFFVLVLTTIQLESGVSEDPPLENPNLEELFSFQVQRLREDNPLAGKLLEVSELESELRAKLRADTRRGRVRREKALVRYVEQDLRVWLQGRLQERFFLPAAMAAYAAETGLPNPVHTIGPMQVSLQKAYDNARRRGERVESPEEMRRWLLDPEMALERGLKEGVYQLWRIYSFYRGSLSPEPAVRFTTADYNAGEFSSRNAAFQARVSELSGHALVLDGDLLVYSNGRAAERASNTEAAVITLLERYAAPNIRRDLLLEKEARFSATPTARQVCAAWRRRTGKACALAALPVGAVNAVAEIKLGRVYNPENYANAYVRRWRENLERFQQG